MVIKNRRLNELRDHSKWSKGEVMGWGDVIIKETYLFLYQVLLVFSIKKKDHRGK